MLKPKSKELTMRYIQNLIITLVLSACSTGIYAQCASGSFICNDTIQVSVDTLCEAIISADMLLEAPNEDCTYFIRFFDENGDELVVPGNALNKNHVGQIIRVNVEEAGVNNPNSCWAYIKLEDKIPATIECPVFPSFSCLDSDQNDPGRTDEELAARIRREIIIQDVIQDNCTDTASFEVSIIRNQLKQLICSDDFGAQRLIEYDLIGVGGRVLLNCVDTIFFEKFNSEDVDDPRDFIGDDALECDGTWIGGTWEQDIDSLELAKFDICIYPNFWELFDADPTSFPSIDGRPLVEYDEELEAFVRKGFCNINAAFTDLPPFEICGKSYKLIRSWTIIDWCKQSAPRMVNQIIEVRDTEAPEFFIPNIPDVEAGANTCNMVVVLPEPVVTKECNDWTYCISFKYPNTDVFVALPEYQSLDTSQVLSPIILPTGITTIKYTVKDLCGNEDSKETDVEVLDVQPPIAICDTRTVLTLNNNNKGKIFPPTIDDKSFDNCTDTLKFKMWREDGNFALVAPDSSFVKFDADDIGKDVRVMLQVKDEGGLKNLCWTTVEVNSNVPVLACPSDISPLDFCDNFISYLPEQQGLEAVEIERNVTTCGSGYLIVQWIDVSGEVSSVLCIGDTIFFEPQNSVNTAGFALPLDITIAECDNTDPSLQDLADILGTSNACNVEVIFQDVVFSEKIFRNFTVIDLCANVALMHHTQIIEIIPTSLEGVDISTIFSCPNPGITIEMEEDGSVEVTGHDVNNAVGDECITDLDIRIRKRDEGGEFLESITFDCDNLAVVVVFDVEIALYDRDGAFVEMCHTEILIDDNIAVACPAGSGINISGSILTENQEAVENVSIELRSLSDEKIGETSTSTYGLYAFTDMNPEQYRIVTTRNDAIINGVSTLDLVLIQQHILGLKTFDSPYKVIAADINNNQQVSASDLVELRKVVLGISDAFTNNSSWRFAETGQIFNDILNPWPFNEVMDINGSGIFDFIGIKIGDVNINAVANSLMLSGRSNPGTFLTITDCGIKRGELGKIKVRLDDNSEDAIAFQLRLNIDNTKLKVTNIYTAQGEKMNSEEYVIADNMVTISHMNPDINSELFVLEFEGVSNSNSIADAIGLDEYRNEWYSSDFNTFKVGHLSFEKVNHGIEVHLSPNPFSESTAMIIYCDQDQNATMRIFNINGKEVYKESNLILSQGENIHTVSSSDLSEQTGIFIYSLEFGNQNIKGKMVHTRVK